MDCEMEKAGGRAMGRIAHTLGSGGVVCTHMYVCDINVSTKTQETGKNDCLWGMGLVLGWAWQQGWRADSLLYTFCLCICRNQVHVFPFQNKTGMQAVAQKFRAQVSGAHSSSAKLPWGAVFWKQAWDRHTTFRKLNSSTAPCLEGARWPVGEPQQE